MKTRVIVIGAGPAGIAASVQLQRQGMRPLVFEMSEPGGLLREANWIENYPGFPAGISGRDLSALFASQFSAHVERFVHGEVRLADWRDGRFVVMAGKKKYVASHLVVASGTKPRPSNEIAIAPGAEERVFRELGKLASAAHVRIVIVGAGDAAFDWALSLAGKNEVVVLGRGGQARALPLLQARARSHPGIRFHARSEVKRIEPAPGHGIVVCTTRGGRPFHFTADWALLALGRDPRTGFFAPCLASMRKRLARQNLLHLAGDVKSGDCRQVGIAVGDGIRAAMAIAAFGKEERR